MLSTVTEKGTDIMNRCRLLLFGIALGVVAVGPPVAVATFLLRMALDLVSARIYGDGRVFAMYASQVGLGAAATGFLSGLACGLTAGRPRATAILVGCTALAVLAAPMLYVMARDHVDPVANWRWLADAAIQSLGASITGYLTALWAPAVARTWGSWWPERPPEPPPARSPNQRYRL